MSVGGWVSTVSNEPGEFRDEIEYLSDRAAAERAHVAERSKPVPQRSAIRTFIWIGVFLVVMQAGLFAYLSLNEEKGPPAVTIAQNPLLVRQDCEGEKYRTYRKIAQYMRQHGSAPESLDVLVGTVFPTYPVDPNSNQRLKYSKVGNGFRLECPQVAATG